jgi:putative hydrolase of the HAD superfamily
MIQNINTILFDFGGVLVDLDKEACLEAFKKLGVRNLNEYISNYAQSGLFLQLEKGLISPEYFHEQVRKMSDRNISDEEIDDAWNQFLITIPPYKLDFLLELRKKYRVLLLSNTNAIHFNQKGKSEFEKQGLSLNNYFDKCYLSFQLGMAKPDEDIFKHVLENEQAKAHEILFLDDGEQNIETAKKIGFTTYLVKEKEDFRPLFSNFTALWN